MRSETTRRTLISRSQNGPAQRAGEAARESGAVEAERRDNALDRGQDMDEKQNESWTLVRVLETHDWLTKNAPMAVDWFLLWGATATAKKHAIRMAQYLPQHRSHHMIQSHVDVERQSCLGLIAELLAVRTHADIALEANDVRPEIVARIMAKRARLDDLIEALQVDSADGLRPEPKP